MKTIFHLILFVCFCGQLCHAQPASWQATSKQEIIEKYKNACNWLMNTPSYFFRINYTSYKDHVTKDYLESSDAYYKKVANNYCMEALGVKTVQNSKMKIIVDTANSTVTVMSPSSVSLTIADAEQLEAMLSSTKALKKIRTSKTTVCYHIDFNKNRLYEAYEFSVNDKGVLERLTFYYSEQEDTNEQAEGAGNNEPAKGANMKPRLEILFSGYQVPANYSKSDFEDSRVVVNEQGKIQLMGPYKHYRLLDYRLQSDK